MKFKRLERSFSVDVSFSGSIPLGAVFRFDRATSAFGMSKLRTSRILQFLLAAAMVAGPVLPLVQMLCGMESPVARSQMMATPEREGMRHVADMPCPSHDAAEERRDAVNSTDDDAARLRPEAAFGDCPTCDIVRGAYRTCCRPADAAIAAALPIKYSERTCDFFSAVSPLPGAIDASLALREPPAPASYAVPIPSPVNHQALLATFLI